MLDHAPNVTSLDIDCYWDPFCPELDTSMRQLVCHAATVRDQWSWLNSLRLHGVPLYYDGYKFPKLPGLSRLKHLQLISCCDCDGCLEMLTALSLNLDSLAIEDPDYGPECSYATINNFIRSLKSLPQIFLTLTADFGRPDDGLFHWSTLHAHASSVKCAKVYYHSWLQPFPSSKMASDFWKFCTSASDLEQLSMSGIEVQHEATLSGSKPGSLEHLLVGFWVDPTAENLSLISMPRTACNQYVRSRFCNSRCG